MSDASRNSVTPETCPTPDQVMGELGIPKSTYYEWMNYLGEKAAKQNGRAYLSNEQLEKLQDLKTWVDKNGQKKGFLDAKKMQNKPAGELAVAAGADLAAAGAAVEAEQQFIEDEGDRVFEEAAKLAAHRLYTLPAQVVDQLAQQMTPEDIPSDIAAAAQQNAQQVIAPTALDPKAVAQNLLQRRREQSGAVSTASA